VLESAERGKFFEERIEGTKKERGGGEKTKSELVHDQQMKSNLGTRF